MRTTNLKTVVVISLFLLGMVSTATGEVIYVDDDAPLGGNGTSWATAYRYLQDAQHKPPTYGDEIWVAQGTYKPDEDTANPGGTGDRAATFQLKIGVAIYGGFAGTETSLDERDWQTNETILSGDLDGNDVQVPDPCDLLTETTRSENSYHVVSGSDTDGTAVLDGFTITAGNANGSNPYNKGGGMYNAYGNPTVTNCTFSDNTATYEGGGMWNDSSSPTVTNCTFSDNVTDNYGGGMWNHNNSPTVSNCTFTGNSAVYGGGMYNVVASPTISNCRFIANSAVTGGGMNNQHDCTITVTKCTFIGNTAVLRAGGMQNYGSRGTVRNCTFIGNSTDGTGGGMENTSFCHTYITVTNCLFSGNIADGGGGMRNYNNSSPTVTNCTFSGNSANSEGGGMENWYHCNPTMSNCIFWGNTAPTAPQIYNNASSPTITYSDVEGGWPGEGNINADPLFVSGPWGDYYLSHIAAGQISNSPCIDIGSDLASALGMDTLTTRIDHITDAGQVDMGYHYLTNFPESPIEALIDIDPDTLNKKSHGRWLTVYITLPDGYDVGAIDTSTVAITSLVGETCVPEYSQQADLSFVPQVGDRNEDGILDLTVKFDRQVLLANLCLDDVSITIEGELTTGELFSGSDSIRIIDRGK